MFSLPRYVQQRSPWCIAFIKNHLKLLEYAEDLKSYFKSGYGNRVSPKIGCGPIKDFYDRFERTVNGESFQDEYQFKSFLFFHMKVNENFKLSKNNMA